MSIAPSMDSIAAVTERSQFWEMMIAAVSEEMARGTVGELMASKLDRIALEVKLGKHDRKDLSVLLRRVASYVFYRLVVVRSIKARVFLTCIDHDGHRIIFQLRHK